MEKQSSRSLRVYYEETVPESSTVWFHPVSPLVATVSDKNLIKISNFETGKCLAFFDIFSGKKAYTDPRAVRPFKAIDVVFVDRQALIWKSGSSDVASGILSRLLQPFDIQSLVLVDRCALIRWDYCSESWAMADILIDGRVGATKGILYDENHIVLGFEDGTMKLFNYTNNTCSMALKAGHGSSISHLFVIARDLASKPLVVSAETQGLIFCWNMESQAVAFRFSEMVKGKSVRPR
jgi:WD40 repeat protein